VCVAEVVKPDPRQRRLREVPIEDLAEQVGVRRAAVRLGEDDPVVDRSEPTDHPLLKLRLAPRSQHGHRPRVEVDRAPTRRRLQSLAAHDTGVRAVLDFVERHATTRGTVDGAVQHVDVDGLAMAVFRQHTSRLLDPQLHTHAVIAVKVRISDGRWLALDARLIKHDQQTLSALYHATLRSELTHRLGVSWQTPVNGIAEIDGVPDEVLADFSQRTRQVEARLERKLDRFRASFDRDPTPQESWWLEREAVLDSRPSKRKPGEPIDLRGEWASRIEGLGHDPRGVADDAVGGLPTPSQLTAPVQVTMTDQALASLAESSSTWRPNDLLRELARAVPTTVHGG
jgi:conjugative relaxase-like TrwC/TraI family protein